MKYILATLLLGLCQVVCGHPIRVVSFNMRYANDRDMQRGNGWDQRCKVICEQIRYEGFDVIGAQEVLKSQLDDLLIGVSSEYSCVGVGRNDGRVAGEFAPIFFRKDRFDKLDAGHFWLSETPDVAGPGWDAKYPRICTWVWLHDKISDKKFLVFNTHFDHVGILARSESARLILSRIRAMSSCGEAILTGDFNVDQHSPSYRVLTANSYLQDTYETARIRMAQNGTVNGFDVNRKSDRRIDYVLVTRGFRVLRYGILTGLYWVENSAGETTARTVSDHYPVCVQLLLD